MLRAARALIMKTIRRFCFRACLKPNWDSAAPTRSFVSQILKLAKGMGKQRAVAQNLVGAVLQLRFSGVEATDKQRVGSCRSASGDFRVGDTAFYVTDIPTSIDFEKCLNSLRNGFRVYLLVPDEITQGARLTGDFHAPENIAVESIESFVARSIDVSSSFQREARMAALRTLVEAYNASIDATGAESSIGISLPRELASSSRAHGALAAR